jgi:hypothetical protein
VERVVINALARLGIFVQLSNARDALANLSCALTGFVWHRPAVGAAIHCLTSHRSPITLDAALTDAAEASGEVSASE